MGQPRDDSTDPTLTAFSEAYLRWSRGRHTRRSYETRKRQLEGTVLPVLGTLRLTEVTRLDIEALLASNEAWSPATQNRVLSAVSAVFRRAKALGLVERNPAEGIDRAREHVVPIPLVSLKRQDALVDALPETMRPLFTAALDTGARLGELLRLRWTDVDLPQKTLQIGQSKSGRPRLLRLTRRLHEVLETLRREWSGAHTALLFADAVGGDGELRWRWRHAFKRAAAEVGLTGLRIHDLRHLHAIALVRAGIDLPTIQAQLGHRHLVSTLRYAAYADESASARAARALDRLRRVDRPE